MAYRLKFVSHPYINRCLEMIVKKKNNLHSSVDEVKKLEGPLKVNSLLNNAERLFEGKLESPEHILERDGVLYVVLRTNEIVKIVNNEIKVLTSFGKSCCKSFFHQNPIK
jgi:hypothetical protein